MSYTLRPGLSGHRPPSKAVSVPVVLIAERDAVGYVPKGVIALRRFESFRSVLS